MNQAMPHALVQGGTSYIAHLLNPRLSPVPPVTCTPLDTQYFEGAGGSGGYRGGPKEGPGGPRGPAREVQVTGLYPSTRALWIQSRSFPLWLLQYSLRCSSACLALANTSVVMFSLGPYAAVLCCISAVWQSLTLYT